MILGHGIDNHFLGLRETAVELGMPTPAIFADESYSMSIHFTVSTSQVKTLKVFTNSPQYKNDNIANLVLTEMNKITEVFNLEM